MRTIYLLSIVLILSGCIERVPHELKSPCVANNHGLFLEDNTNDGTNPCIRRRVNDHWLKEYITA